MLTRIQEPDSDSDFNPGSFVPEPKKKRGRRSGESRKSGEPPRKRRRRESLEDGGSRERSIGKLGLGGGAESSLIFIFLDGVRTGDAVPLQRNLLTQYFGG